jgi:hypothetical protein
LLDADGTIIHVDDDRDLADNAYGAYGAYSANSANRINRGATGSGYEPGARHRGVDDD